MRDRVLEGDKNREEILLLEAQIDGEFEALRNVQSQYGVALQADAAGLAQRGRQQVSIEKLSALWQQAEACSVAEIETDCQAYYVPLLDGLLTLVTHVGDTSNLILDPDLDSYYLMDMTLLAIPQMQNRLQDILFFLQDMQHNGIVDEDSREKLAVYHALLLSDIERVSGSAQTAINEDGNFYDISLQLQRDLDPALQECRGAMQSFLDDLEILADTDVFSEAQQAAILSDGIQAFSNSFDLWDSTRLQLDTLLEIRISHYEAQRNRNLFLTLLSVIISGVVFLVVSRSITRPLSCLSQVARQLADEALPQFVGDIQSLASGDLTQEIHLETTDIGACSQDEIGKLAEAFLNINQTLEAVRQAMNRMREQFYDIIRQLTGEIEAVNDASNSLSLIANRSGEATTLIVNYIGQIADSIADQSGHTSLTASAIEQMNLSIEGVAKSSQEQADMLSSALTGTHQMVEAMQQVSENTRIVTVRAAEAAEAARAGGRTFDETLETMNSIKQKVDLSGEKIRDMGKRSEEIGSIVGSIREIASQTNLLALNAAIEAAQAGQHGAGFAVVAEEVRKLAEKVTLSSQEIESLIQGIQNSVLSTEIVMNDGSLEVDKGVEKVNQTGKALKDILVASEEVKNEAEMVMSAVVQINDTVAGLNDKMDMTSALVGKNSEVTETVAVSSGEVIEHVRVVTGMAGENHENINSISELTVELNGQVKEISTSVESMTNLAVELRKMVARFII